MAGGKQLIFSRFSNKDVQDKRSRRIVAVIHCILNQNARDHGAAAHHAMNKELLEVFSSNDVALLQMPCPEMHCLGLKRERPKGYSIRDMLELPGGTKCCGYLSVTVADQIQEFVADACEVLAVIGGDVESPGCAVHLTGEGGMESRLTKNSGVFMKALEQELIKRDLRVPFVGWRESDPEKVSQDLAWIKTRIGC